MKTLFSLLLGLSVLQAQVKEVKIGTQVWMAENLNVFYFKNGDAIPIVKTNDEWQKAGKNKKPACCYYENNAENGKTYGLIYNWYAVNDKRGLAPAGYHIPTFAEWSTLFKCLGDDDGRKMQSTSGWIIREGNVKCIVCKSWTPEQKAGQTCTKCNDTRVTKGQISYNGTNSSGFNGLPGGRRKSSGAFGGIGQDGYWWCSGEYDDELVDGGCRCAICIVLSGGFGDIILQYHDSDDTYNEGVNKGCGYYLRCLRD